MNIYKHRLSWHDELQVCIFISFGSFVMIKLIPFEKIFENFAGVVLLLAKQVECCCSY